MKESAIQTSIETFLKGQREARRLVYIKNNSGAVKTKHSFIRFGMKGSSDFIIFANGGVLFLEVKNAIGKLRPSQIEFQEAVTRLGYDYKVVRSREEAENVVFEYILEDTEHDQT